MPLASIGRSLTPGDLVAGRYRIDGLLGQGGFGAVFRASEVESGRAVALKVLLPNIAPDPAGRTRFQREAETAKILEHPNTVQMFGCGVAEDGLPYIAWELLEGRPLDVAIAEGPMPAARVGHIVAQVLRSLEEAHDKGIVHRDIKPANIFLLDKPGEPDYVKVLDFGIAKLMPAPGGEAPAGLTRKGEAMGTPNYMAPEQVLGGTLTPATDLYALGLTMAEMLTGKRIYEGESPIEIAERQISPDPVPLPTEVLASRLGSVIVRATKKQPAERYATAADMLSHLEEAMTRLDGSDSAYELPVTIPAQDVRSDLQLAPAGPAEPSPKPLPPTEASIPVGEVIREQAPLAERAPKLKRAPSPTPWLALGLGGITLVALVVLFFAAGGLEAFRHMGGTAPSPSGSVAPSVPGSTTASVAPSKPRARTRIILRTATLASLRDRLEDTAWDPTTDYTPTNGEAHVIGVHVKKDNRQGLVIIQRFDRETAAIAMEKVKARTSQYPVYREGTRLLEVTIHNDVAASKALMNELLAK